MNELVRVQVIAFRHILCGRDKKQNTVNAVVATWPDAYHDRRNVDAVDSVQWCYAPQ